MVEETITEEKQSIKLTLVFSVERENLNDLSIRKLWFEREYVFEISDSRKCRTLKKSSYPFDRDIKQEDGSFKSKTFWGYKIFHISPNGVCQEIDCSINEDSAHALGLKVSVSTPKRIRSNERLQELLLHCESDYCEFEGKMSQGKTRRF